MENHHAINGKSTISMAMFNSFLLTFTRWYIPMMVDYSHDGLGMFGDLFHSKFPSYQMMKTWGYCSTSNICEAMIPKVDGRSLPGKDMKIKTYCSTNL